MTCLPYLVTSFKYVENGILNTSLAKVNIVNIILHEL